MGEMTRRGDVLFDCMGLPDCGVLGGRCLCRRRVEAGGEARRPGASQGPPRAAPTLGDLYPELLARWLSGQEKRDGAA